MELLTNTTTTFISTLVNKKSKADPYFMDKEITYKYGPDHLCRLSEQYTKIIPFLSINFSSYLQSFISKKLIPEDLGLYCNFLLKYS